MPSRRDDGNTTGTSRRGFLSLFGRGAVAAAALPVVGIPTETAAAKPDGVTIGEAITIHGDNVVISDVDIDCRPGRTAIRGRRTCSTGVVDTTDYGKLRF